MKQKVLSMLLALIICATSIICWDVDVKAQVPSEDIDMSSLLTEDALIGYADTQTWGVYYSDGNSVINTISSTKVGAGGVTNAAGRCTVSITSILERKEGSSWVRVTSWSQTNNNAFTAMISKSVTVASGYYYRVRSHHYAGTDSSSSCTSALWIGK